jgi:hypothetical protein
VPDWINVMGKGLNIHCSFFTFILFLSTQKRASITIDPLVLTRRIVVANQVGSIQSGPFLVIENIAFPTVHLISICFEWSDRRVIALRTMSLFHLLGRRSFAVVVDYSTWRYDGILIPEGLGVTEHLNRRQGTIILNDQTL